MAKPKTPEEFTALVTADFTWRLRELSNLKLAIATAGMPERPTFLRALVVMCYAHWEGHAKFCADRFVEFLTLRRLRFSELAQRFYEVRFFREISAAGSMSHHQKLSLVEKILTSSDDRFSSFPKELIDTRANLNSLVLEELCLVCDIDFSPFREESDFIDRLLLKRRNEVAHGEAVFIEVVDADDLIDRTSMLMRLFRDQLDNSVTLQSYRAAA